MMKLSGLAPGRNTVHFESRGYQLAGYLFFPANFDQEKTYPVVIMTTPFTQIKEQTGSVYGQKLADAGMAAFTFDYRGFGESEGELRHTMLSPMIVEGVTDAISFLRAQDFIDSNKVYGLGICAGATHIITVAVTDKRLQAVATVSGMLCNPATFFDAMSREDAVELLKAAGEAEQKYYETGVQESLDIHNLAIKPGEDAPRQQQEGYDYYMTARAGKERYPAYTQKQPLFVHMDYPRYNATAMAPYLYTPYLGIYGSEAGALGIDGDESTPGSGASTSAFYQAATEPKELYEVEGASHISLYDQDEDVDRAVQKLTAFFSSY